MKFWVFFFAAYLMALSAVPCDDAANPKSSISIPESHLANHKSASDEPSHEGHHHNVEHCSPFCACGCCSVLIANYTPQNYVRITKPLVMPSVSPESLYSNNFISHYTGSIWQPPQIS